MAALAACDREALGVSVAAEVLRHCEWDEPTGPALAALPTGSLVGAVQTRLAAEPRWITVDAVLDALIARRADGPEVREALQTMLARMAQHEAEDPGIAQGCARVRAALAG